MSGTALERRMSRNNSDEPTRAMLYEGASVNQLGVIFGMNNTEVAAKMRKVAPSGMRSGYPIYKIADAAAVLVRPTVDVEAYIAKMGIKDFPLALQKDYYAALLARLKFEKEQGVVFHVEKVQQWMAEAFKVVRMRLLLAPDEAEREGKMSGETLKWFRGYIDDTLRGLRSALDEAFTEMGPLESGIVEYESDDADQTSSPVEEDDEL